MEKLEGLLEENSLVIDTQGCRAARDCLLYLPGVPEKYPLIIRETLSQTDNFF